MPSSLASPPYQLLRRMSLQTRRFSIRSSSTTPQIYKYQHTPLPRIQQWSGSPDTRLFDTLLVYQKFSIEQRELLLQMTEDQATVDYPVSIEVEAQEHGLLQYRVTFFSDILAAEQARLLLRQLEETVWHIATNPNADNEAMESLTPELFSIAPPEQPILESPVEFAHQFVESQARTNPTKVALHFVDGLQDSRANGRTWTYKQLDDNGNRVARKLLPHVRVGDTVAIHFEKCPEAFFAILGILKAGCGFLALDPSAPASRKEFILKDARAPVLLVSTAGSANFDLENHPPLLHIDESALVEESPEPVALASPLSPQDPCYCLYTSGTTGLPKGCEITHEKCRAMHAGIPTDLFWTLERAFPVASVRFLPLRCIRSGTILELVRWNNTRVSFS